MFTTDESVNYLFSYIKKFLNPIFKNKNYPEKFKNMQILAFAAFLAFYGFDYVKEIYSVFIKTNFVYDNNEIDNYAKKNSMDYEKNNFRSSTPAFCTSKVESVNGTFLIERSLFLYDIDQKMYGVLMENFLHEINHLVNSKRHTIFKKNGIWYLRDGISVTNLNVSMTFGKMIDESFNVMQTADIFNELLKFSKFNIEDPALAEELKKLRYFPKSDGKGYELTTPLIKPLYKNPNFRYVLNRQKMEGNIQLISREFDSKTHPNAYNELSNALENIGIEIGPNCFTEGIKVKSLVKEYLK